MDAFSITPRVFSSSFTEGMELVFADDLVPLMIQEGYVHAGREMDEVASAADDLSRGDLYKRMVYQKGDWSMASAAAAAAVSAARTVTGRPPFQCFPQVLGKMSKQRKHAGWLADMARRASSSSTAFRLDRMECLGRVACAVWRTKEMVGWMEGVGLLREDLEAMEEMSFTKWPVETKARAALTREWKKTHGVTRRGGGGGGDETNETNGDGDGDSDSDETNEANEANGANETNGANEAN